MNSKHSNKLLVVLGLVALLVAGFMFGASTVSADEPVGEPVVVADEPAEECVGCECPAGDPTPCRRSDCPCGASWQDCGCVPLVEGPCVCRCWCRCDPCDVHRAGNLGYVYATHHRWGISYGRSVLGQARVGFWGPSPEEYQEYRAWTTVPLGGLPEREVEKATLVLDVATTWLATDENTSLVVELIDIGPWWPEYYYQLNWPLTVAELLRLTTGEVSEMVNYYGEPVQFAVPPSLLEERIARGSYLTGRLRFEGAPANNLLDVSSATLYIRWVD